MGQLTKRSQFSVGDLVSFPMRGSTVKGFLMRLNPRTAHVEEKNGKAFRVPYSLLTREAALDIPEKQSKLAQFNVEAERLMVYHGLRDWTFEFDVSKRRAGLCNSRKQIISMSQEYVKAVSEEEAKDTLLHEIAHALVGGQQHHNIIWRAEARRLGCSAKVCHDVTFSRPRYVTRCDPCQWVHKAERRNKRAICAHCEKPIEYLPYSDELWESLREQYV